MLGRVGVGADREPDVVGLVAAGGPQLLAVDDVVVAVPPGRGAQRREVGAGVRLGVADREVHVAGQDPLEEQVLLLLAAVPDQRRADGLQRDGGQVHVGVLRLVGEDRLLDLAEPVAAVLLGPADAHLAVLAHLPDHPLVDVAVPVERHLSVLVVTRPRPVKYSRVSALNARCAWLSSRFLVVGSSTGDGLGADVERVGDVGDPAEVVVQRVGLVDAHAAVQVVAGAQRRRRLGAGPVRRDREVVARVEPLVESPGDVLGREVEGARGDVDVGDLHRDRLELGQRPAELGAALDVRRGQVARAGHDPGGGEAEAGDVALGEQSDGALAEQLGPRTVEDDGVGR